MIVVDASAVLELLLGRPSGPAAAARLLDPAEALHAPHLLGIEVAQVLRRFAAAGGLSDERADEARTDYLDLRVERHFHEPLLERIWQLRHNMTAYDAAYVALAEALDAPLVTCDGRLSRAPDHRARIEVL